MIRTFADEGTEDIYNGEDTRAARRVAPKAIWPTAQRKLSYLHAARELYDLRAPPGNRLESLQGDRIVFRWHEGGAEEVCITDYH